MTLTQVELQNLKQLINMNDIKYQKLNSYASSSTDPQIKQLFTKASQDALNSKQMLLTFLE